jgi:signal transduction histidine kinase
MNDDNSGVRGQALADEGLRFFGSITASVTHDLTNVIAIIDQTSGLIQDMVVAEKSGSPLSVERLSDAIGTTQKQSNRALEIIRRLNQFAHSADDSGVVFDVPDVIENLVEICRRFAALKRATFELDTPPGRIQIEGNPFLFQDAVYRALRLALGPAQPGDAIRISLEGDDADVSVRVESPRGIDPGGDDMTTMIFVVAEMSGRVELEQRGDGTVMKLVFSRRGGAHPEHRPS